jgi:carbonic anhydrase
MTRYNYYLLISILFFFSCSKDRDRETIPNSDQDFYTLEGLDHGLIQSPVNILTTNHHESVEHDIEVEEENSTQADIVINTGHSVQLDFNPGTKISFEGKEYCFLQAHFHTPSEHQIDGITYPMEIHFVSMADKINKHSKPEYLVVGAFFRMGKENKFIEGFIERIPTNDDSIAHLKENTVHINDLLLPEEPFNDYYHYRGSLTTPPYTESVDWVIMKRIIDASPEQIRYINKLEGNNARHVQALFGRTIEEN